MVWLMQVQPYISQFYEASKHIMSKVAEENDHAIPPDAKRLFAEQINATTISLPSNHASPLSHPNEVAQLILDAANKLTG